MKTKEQLIAKLDDCTEKILLHQKELSPDELNFKPDNKRWSILEVVEHITILDTLVMNKVEPVLQETKGASKKPSKFGVIERWFMGYIHPNSRLKLIAPKIYKPPASSDLDADETFARFKEHQKRMRDMIALAEECDQRKKVASPFTIFLRLSVVCWMHLGIIHQQRHLLQVERIRKKLRESTQIS